MPRYPQRPWYNPLGMMAQNPVTYAFQAMSIGFIIFYPFRYSMSDWYERQQLSQGSLLRSKASQYYREVERTHRRQALINQPMLMDEIDQHATTVSLGTDAMRAGVTDHEFQYWYAHQRDAIRAEKLVEEIKELQAKIANAA